MQFIRASGQSLAELVSDLLDLARIEAGKTTLRTRAFTASELFGALRGMFRPSACQRRMCCLCLKIRLKETLLNTDEGKVAQILRNFISNALKFTEQGSVRVQLIEAGDNRVRFAVSDTGIGIAPENQQHIFEEFAQIENPLQTRARGTGLGLSLTRKLAELLGGRIWVQSEPGKGSAFYAEIPRIFDDEDARREGHTVEAEYAGNSDTAASSLIHNAPYSMVSDTPLFAPTFAEEISREANHA